MEDSVDYNVIDDDPWHALNIWCHYTRNVVGKHGENLYASLKLTGDEEMADIVLTPLAVLPTIINNIITDDDYQPETLSGIKLLHAYYMVTKASKYSQDIELANQIDDLTK